MLYLWLRPGSIAPAGYPPAVYAAMPSDDAPPAAPAPLPVCPVCKIVPELREHWHNEYVVECANKDGAHSCGVMGDTPEAAERLWRRLAGAREEGK